MAHATTFMSKANRDAAFKALGGRKAGYSRTSMRNQLLHPQYVDDYEQVTGHKLQPADKTLGNTIYKRCFGVLYMIQRKRTLTATEERAGEAAWAAANKPALEQAFKVAKTAIPAMHITRIELIGTKGSTAILTRLPGAEDIHVEIVRPDWPTLIHVVNSSCKEDLTSMADCLAEPLGGTFSDYLPTLNLMAD